MKKSKCRGRHPRTTTVQLQLENGALGEGVGVAGYKTAVETHCSRWLGSKHLCHPFCVLSVSTMESTLAEAGGTVPFLREQSKCRTVLWESHANKT